jgi:hypothetical protein
MLPISAHTDHLSDPATELELSRGGHVQAVVAKSQPEGIHDQRPGTAFCTTAAGSLDSDQPPQRLGVSGAYSPCEGMEKRPARRVRRWGRLALVAVTPTRMMGRSWLSSALRPWDRSGLELSLLWWHKLDEV